MSAAAAVITKPSLTLADRLKIQQERSRNRDYVIMGRLTAVLFEGQRKTHGYSQSRPRYFNSEQAKQMSDSMKPFSEAQNVLWSSLTLDWLGYKNAPVVAVSKDLQDLLLPFGLPKLPAIPDPRWVPKRANDIAPRIPQLLVGCPVVGDRVRDKIRSRDGRTYGVLHPIVELSVMLMKAAGAFQKVRGLVDPTDGTHLALLIDDSDPENMQGYFVGGRFQIGG